MLIIICGEDTVSSRKYLQSLMHEYIQKDYWIKNLTYDSIDEILKWQKDSPSLFAQKKLFVTEYISKKIPRKSKIMNILQKIHKEKNITLIDWENESGRSLKFIQTAVIKEFRPHQHIFTLLDSFYPSNKAFFLKLLQSLSETQDEHFIFLMLQKLVRNLILVKSDKIPSKVQSWQLHKLKSQARHWRLEDLVKVYETFMRIEIGEKSGMSPYSVKESLDIIACHFL